MRRYLLLALLLGCKWSEFDDLEDTTWVRSTDEPGIGSRNFGIALLGVTTSTTGGQLAVISDDTPDFSVLAYDADGNDSVSGNSLKLGQHRIAALTDPPLFATDGMGRIVIAERSTTGGNISVVFGMASAPVGIEFAATPATPSAVIYAGQDIIVATGNSFYTLTSNNMQIPCMNADAAFATAALATDGTNLWVWSTQGAFFKYPLTALTPCNGGMLPAAGNTFMTGLMPGTGARIHLVGSYAILTAHAPMSRMGQVFVVDLATMTQSDTMLIEGLRSSTMATFGSDVLVAIGVPDRAVGGVLAGQVDLFTFDDVMGKLNPTPAMTLNDAEPESGQLYGRAVTTMKFNDQEILVVAANSEVFAYYKTVLYDALP
jgi:hypothetical protein